MIESMTEGVVIEVTPMHIPIVEGGKPARKVTRLWIADDSVRIGGEEVCMFVVDYDAAKREGPRKGERVSWEPGCLFFDNDRLSIARIGRSFAAPIMERT